MVCIWKSFTWRPSSLGLGTVFTQHSDLSHAAWPGNVELHTHNSHILDNPKTTRNTIICSKHREQWWIYSASRPSSCITRWQALIHQLMTGKNMVCRVKQTWVWIPALTVTSWLNSSGTPISHPFIHPFKKYLLRASCVPDLVTGTGDAMVIRKRPNACPHEASLIRKTRWIKIHKQSWNRGEVPCSLEPRLRNKTVEAQSLVLLPTGWV